MYDYKICLKNKEFEFRGRYLGTDLGFHIYVTDEDVKIFVSTTKVETIIRD